MGTNVYRAGGRPNASTASGHAAAAGGGGDYDRTTTDGDTSYGELLHQRNLPPRTRRTLISAERCFSSKSLPKPAKANKKIHLNSVFRISTLSFTSQLCLSNLDFVFLLFNQPKKAER